MSDGRVSANREIPGTVLVLLVVRMGKFQARVQCKASRESVYQFLCQGAGTRMKMTLRDPVAFRVTLRSRMGIMSWGEVVECTVTPTQAGCSVLLEGRPVLATNVTADVSGTVSELATSLVLQFGGK